MPIQPFPLLPHPVRPHRSWRQNQNWLPPPVCKYRLTNDCFVSDILHQGKSLSGYPFLHLNWYISNYYISHSSLTIISDNYISKRILLPQYFYVFTIFIRRFVFTVSRIEVTRNEISSNYAGKPIIIDHFYLTARKRSRNFSELAKSVILSR